MDRPNTNTSADLLLELYPKMSCSEALGKASRYLESGNLSVAAAWAKAAEMIFAQDCGGHVGNNIQPLWCVEESLDRLNRSPRS